jgi:hypothetical protein
LNDAKRAFSGNFKHFPIVAKDFFNEKQSQRK